ncbi:isoamyl alcohol oxidase [Xylariaceae sp. FL0016]|nr:isoamyl alcohol oxidase [Xylariaceae sp. FL0016]
MRTFLYTAAALSAVLPPALAAADDCRCFPGDACWPTEETWSALNASVGGNLHKTVPIGSVCHDPQYDEAACEAVKAAWLDPAIHIDSSHSVQSALFANASCDPLAPREAPCVIGTYVQYAVAVESAEDVSKTVKFANENNIRLVIRNTAHDYLGKSTGAGAIAIWTKNLKSVEKVTWKDSTYQGDAMKLGAGVSGAEVAVFGHQHGILTPSGNCPTVGPVGGFVQGGGHGPLGSKYGMLADNALEFEVVDGAGNLLTANREQNSDLYWALRGGGPGTWGVVTSMTAVAYPDIPITFGTIMFASAGLSEDQFYGAVASFYDVLPSLVDAGCVAVFLWTPDAFVLSELICPDLSEDEVNKLIEPFITKLGDIQYQKTIKTYEGYLDFQTEALDMMTKHQANFIMGGSWLMPRSVMTDTNGSKQFLEAAKQITLSGAFVQQLAFNFEKKAKNTIDNAVLPAWRDTLVHAVVAVPYNPTGSIEENLAAYVAVNDEKLAKLKALAPASGAYMNEAVPFTADWKTDFYGANYERLAGIKDRYDPEHLFYAFTGVGSDYWVEQPDKRLCKASASARVKDEL